MKRILLIGDSTMFGSSASSGYGVYVARHYAEGETGEVILPSDNCQDTRFTKNAFLEIFEADKEKLSTVDVIHWNNGLWDVMHFLGSKRPVVPIDRYRDNLVAICEMLKCHCPRARIIFATTTPVYEAQLDETYRRNEEIREYNRVAEETLTPLGCEINDIGGYADLHLWENRASDDVHFDEDGCIALSTLVCAAIDKL